MADRLRIYIVRFTADSWEGKEPKVVYPLWQDEGTYTHDDTMGVPGYHYDPPKGDIE